MIRVLLDTNVVLDALFQREPWDTDAQAIWEAHANGDAAAHVTATSLTDIFYIGRRHAGAQAAWDAVRSCLDQLHVISVGFNESRAALAMGGSDFEDNVQVACASAARLDAIVTRDPSGFSQSPVPVWAPQELVERLSAAENGDHA